MILTGAAKRDFEPAPEGLKDALCVDVVDQGMKDTPNGPKRKVRLVFQIADQMTSGKRFIVGTQFTASLHEQAPLRKFLKAWRGRDFTEDELRGFDMEKLVGAPCQLIITHEPKNGEIWANITAVMKAGQNRLAPDADYIRVKNRPGYKPPALPAAKQPEPEPVPEDDVPF
jgi:hypothetical protein